MNKIAATDVLRRTKIIATLGPASDAPGAIEALIAAGVNVVRLNFSHGSKEHHAARIAAVREAAHRLGREVGVLADLQGPKIRIEKFEEGKVVLQAGDQFTLICSADAPLGDRTRVGMSYLGLIHDVVVGDTLLLDDGLMAVRVDAIEGVEIRTTVLTDGKLSDRKGLNRLGGGLSLGALTDKDKRDIVTAAELKVDFVAVSFCRNAADMHEARCAAECGRLGRGPGREDRARRIDSAARRNHRCVGRGHGRARRSRRGNRRRRTCPACRRRSSARRWSATRW
jgi:pyruvate kinase